MSHVYPEHSPACWAVNHFRLVEGNPVWWPAVRTSPEDVEGHAPPSVPDRVLVRYAGPAATKGKPYDMYWLTPGEIWNFRQAKEIVLSKQLGDLERAGHLPSFQAAMEEASKYDKTYDDVNAEKVKIEQDLMQISNSIPMAPRTSFQVFAQARLDEMGDIPENTSTEALQRQFIDDFSAMSAADKSALEIRGQEEHASQMTQAISAMAEVGPDYLKLCEGLNQQPIPQLVSNIQLTVWATALAGSKRKLSALEAPGDGPAVEEVAIRVDGGGEDVSVHLPPVDLALEVVCNDVSATLFPASCRVVLEGGREMTATQFEQYAGCASAKKWKMSLKIKPGQVPECPIGSPPMQVGKWLDLNGWIAGGSRSVKVTRERPVKSARLLEAHASMHGSTHGAGATETPARAPRQTAPRADGAAAPGGVVDAEAALARMVRGEFEPVRVKWAGDRCAVCDSEIDYDYDQLVSCHACGVAVHQSCYGVRDLPGPEDAWLCAACEAVEAGEPKPHCVVCPVEGGALKRTTVEGAWCHVACMQWIPELGAADTSTMEPIQGLHAISPERWGLNCSICRQRVGAKIQCSACCTAFHPLCGRLKGLTMDMLENPDGPELPLVQIVQCAKHCTPRPHATGVSYRLEGGADGQGGASLTSGFPYLMPPGVPPRLPPAGAARLQPFGDVAQERDGTGVGNCTKSAWWIPSSADAAEVQRREAPVVSRRAPRRGRGGRLSTRPRPEKREKKVQEVQLVPLPEGLPGEFVQVACNGKVGTMRLRSQRVSYFGEEFAASKFEALCGKADAKKWKATLQFYNPETGQGEMSMGDWLQMMGVERKVLSGLKENWDAHMRWLESQQQGGGSSVGLAQASGGENEDANGAVVDEDEDVEQDEDEDEADEGEEGPEAEMEVSGLRAADAAGGDGSDVAGALPSPAKENGRSGTLHTADELASLKTEVDADDGGATVGAAQTEGAAARRAGDDAVLDTATGSATAGAASVSGNGAANAEGERRSRTFALAGTDGSVWRLRAARLLPLGAAVPPGTVFSYERSAQEHVGLAKQQLAERSVDDPSSWVGHSVRVLWPADREWYAADVVAWLPEAGAHRVLYHDDGETEVLDLRAESVAGRLQWRDDNAPAHSSMAGALQRSERTELSTSGQAVATPASKAEAVPGAGAPGEAAVKVDVETPTSAVAAAQRAAAAAAAAAGAGPAAAEIGPASWQPNGLTETGHAVPGEEGALGWRVDLLWSDDMQWYAGIVEAFDAAQRKHSITFDDGGREWLRLASCTIRWIVPDAHAACRAARDAYTATLTQYTNAAVESAQREAHARAATAPATVRCLCNGVKGTYHTGSTMIVADGGTRMSPTEFERYSGRGTAKKWKTSIRIAEDGAPAETLGDWLIRHGLDVNRAAIAAAMNPGRRRGAARRASQHFSAAAALGRSVGSDKGHVHGKKRHRPDCTCIICKQARRRGGGGGASGGAGLVPLMRSAGTAAGDARKASRAGDGEGGAPAYRVGKHAYLYSLPYLPGGCKAPGKGELATTPSRCWHPDEWCLSVELHRQLTESQLADVAPILSRRSASGAEDGKATAVRPAVVEGALQRLLQPPGHGSALPTVVTKGTLSRLGAVLPADAAADGGRGGSGDIAAVDAPTFGARLAVTSVRDKVQLTVSFERERLTFNKSGVHGWGLSARQDIPQDSMVIEYRGDMLRPVLQDVKEKGYQRQGVDVYLFALTDSVLIDATMAGTIGRFTNAACQPSMYSKVVEVDGAPTLMFFARTDLKAGQELTYDYRFRAQDSAELTPCLCGAPSCRGTLEVAPPT